MSKKNFFYLTGSFSLLVYIALLFMIFGLINLKQADKFIVKTDTQFEQIIPIEALIEQEIQPKQVDLQSKPKIEEEKEEVQESQKLPGLKDLFSDIPDWSEDARKQKEEQARIKKEQQKRHQEQLKIQQEMLKQQQEQIRNLQSSLQNTNRALEEINTSIDIKTDIPPNQDKGLHDEWVEKIYRILYENWDFSFYQRTIISVLINITSSGSFSYKILKYSQYDDYNQKIQVLLKRLEEVKMPPYPNGKSINIVVNFKSKVRDE